MKKIKLINSNLVALVDDEDFEMVSKHRWSLITYSFRKSFYVGRTDTTNSIAKTVKLHQEILPDIPQGMVIDHKDRNGLNCQKSNLRIATYSQNKGNSEKYSYMNGKPTSSKYKGVSWCKDRGYWTARCNNKNLGGFIKEEDAALAYNKAALRKFGEFALINII